MLLNLLSYLLPLVITQQRILKLLWQNTGRVSNYSRIANKYPLFEIEIKALISGLLIAGEKYEAPEHFTLLKDLSDNKFPDLAYACQADYLITGNHLDFNLTEFYQTKIVSPKQFWELYEAGSL